MIEAATSEAECRAMRLLYEDGWSARELAMVFETSTRHVYPHLNDECVYHRGDVPGSKSAPELAIQNSDPEDLGLSPVGERS